MIYSQAGFLCYRCDNENNENSLSPPLATHLTGGSLSDENSSVVSTNSSSVCSMEPLTSSPRLERKQGLGLASSSGGLSQQVMEGQRSGAYPPSPYSGSSTVRILWDLLIAKNQNPFIFLIHSFWSLIVCIKPACLPQVELPMCALRLSRSGALRTRWVDMSRVTKTTNYHYL